MLVPPPRRLLPCLALAALAAALLTPAASALPRYAASYGQKCLLCHDDPAGGGKRSAYATQYLIPEEMVIRRPADAVLEAIDPALNDRVSLGADLRTLYQYHSDAALKSADSFFQMQASVYLHVQLDTRLSLHVERGPSAGGEAYGLAFVLPAGGYLKAGRFTPAYGWRFGDHTRFVRELTGFAPPANDDVGLELGLFPGGDVSLSAGLFNGSGGQPLDGDNRPAVALRGEWRHEFGGLRAALGGSFYRDEEAGPGLERRLGGPLAYLALGPLTWLGEWDLVRREFEEGPAVVALVASQELDWAPHAGLTLRLIYDHHDPDIDLTTGTHRRLGLGTDLLLTPFVGLQAMFNWHVYGDGPAFTAADHNEATLILHFLY
jgi:hypothetical protein